MRSCPLGAKGESEGRATLEGEWGLVYVWEHTGEVCTREKKFVRATSVNFYVVLCPKSSDGTGRRGEGRDGLPPMIPRTSRMRRRVSFCRGRRYACGSKGGGHERLGNAVHNGYRFPWITVEFRIFEIYFRANCLYLCE